MGCRLACFAKRFVPANRIRIHRAALRAHGCLQRVSCDRDNDKRAGLTFEIACSSIIVIMAGLVLRLTSGRFWLIHRVDGVLLLPNITLCFSICALVYAALGIVNLVDATHIAQGQDYPKRYIGLQAAWPAVLWLGLYTEIWSTYVAYFIRRYGAYTQRSTLKRILATVVPFIFPIIAIVPSAVIFTQAAVPFNSAIAVYAEQRPQLESWRAEWTPDKGLDLQNILTVIEPISSLAKDILTYSRWNRHGFIYESSVLLLTFFIYVTGAYLEISHLRRQADDIRARAYLSPSMRHKSTNSAEKEVKAALDEEWFNGVQKQASILDWAATNRTWTAGLISLMLLENAGLALWYGLAPLSITNNSTQFQSIILVSCWVNGILSTLVSLLILFRSMDGGSSIAKRLQAAMPWLPLPPQMDVRNVTSIKTETRAEKSGMATSRVTNETLWTHSLPSDEGQSFGGGMVQFDLGSHPLPTFDGAEFEETIEISFPEDQHDQVQK